MAVLSTVLAVASFVIAAASTAYQIIQAKKMKKVADAAAEARRGFEIPVEGTSANLSLIYGRAKVGGTRVWHSSGSEYKHVTSNADKIFQTGASARAAYVMSYSFFGPVISSLANNQKLPGYLNVPAQESGYLSSSQVGTKNEYLFFQQALCVSPINGIYDVIIDESRYIDDPSLGTYGYSESDEKTRIKAAMRIDCHYNGAVADSIAAANFSERATALFQDMAYASVVVRMDRDDPQFNGVPALQFLIEGRKVRTVINGVLSTSRTYSNNPAWCLLDYLLDTEVGKAVDPDELDLPSFEAAAAVCATSVQSNVTVGGKLYQPTDGSRNITSVTLPLYECNIILDPQKPVRENIEAVLATMGDGRLVWSAGKYRLSLQYPVSNAAIIVDEVITDDDLVMDQEVQINWPTGSERFNHAVVRFNNEFENFKEDSVSWPPKITDSYYRGIGGKRYGLPTDSWDEGKVGGRLLNNYGVWVGDGTSVSLTYLMKVDGSRAGSYTVTCTADDSLSMSIHETKRAGGDIQVFTNSHNKWDTVRTASVTLGSAGTTKFYRVTITANDSGGDPKKNKKGVAVKIENSTSLLWTTRDPTYSDFVLVDYNKAVYDNMYDEDSDLQLETEIFADGITDPYHALAKAEELVRTSRSAFTIKFKYRIKDKYLEPGDFIRLESSTLGLGFNPDYLYVRVSSVKIDANAVCEVTGSRFDASQLAWNVKDNIYVTAPSLYESRLNAPSNLVYTGPTGIISDSSGVLSWDAVPGFEVAGYVIYSFNPAYDTVDATGQPIYVEIGRSSSTRFTIPPINAASAFFGVKTLGINGRLSQMATLDNLIAQELEHNWIYGLTISLSEYAFVRSKTDLSISPSSIIATANAYNFKNPQYKWYVDGLLDPNTASTLAIPQFSDTRAKFIEVWVNETGSGSFIKAYSSVVYLEEGSDSFLLQVNADRSLITYNSSNTPEPTNQTVTFTATRQNTVAPITWSIRTVDGTPLEPVETYLSFGPGTVATGGTVTGPLYMEAGYSVDDYVIGGTTGGGTTGISEDQAVMTAAQFALASGLTNGVIVRASLTQNGKVITADTSIIKVKQGATGPGALVASLNNPSVLIGTDTNGDNGDFTNSGCVITVKEGSSQLDYKPNFLTNPIDGAWYVTANGGGIVNLANGGIPTDTGTTATFPPINGLSADAGKIVYTIEGRRVDGSAFSTTLEQLFVKFRGAILDITPPGLVDGVQLAYQVITRPDGGNEIKATFTWGAPIANATDVNYYEVGIKKSGEASYLFSQTSGLFYSWIVEANTQYDYIVLAVDKNGNKGASTERLNRTSINDTSAPTQPTPTTSVTSIRTAFLRWTNSSANDLKEVRIFEASVANGGLIPSIPANPIATVNATPGQEGAYSRSGILPGFDYYYWLRSVDTSGNVSIQSTRIGPLVSSQVASDDFTAGTINANILQSATSLPGSLLIGSSGFSLSTINTIAGDPAARINANTSLITPGKVQITGGTTLSDWKNGNNSTEINGGVIAANTVKANSIEIGSRGIDIVGLQFQASVNGSGVTNNTVTWTSGTITFVNDAGVPQSFAIAGGSADYTGSTVYIFWYKEAGVLGATTTTGGAYGANRIVLATYDGGYRLTVNYGRTIINGDEITTNTINGNRLIIGTVDATRIDSRGLTIKDDAGNVIFGAGNALDYARVGGTKPPSNATNGAIFGVNISGQITQSTASTYIADAAIDTAQIRNLAVSTLKIDGNAVTVSDATSLANQVAGTGSGFTWQEVLDYNLNMPDDGTGQTWQIMAIMTASQGFPAGDRTWNIRLKIDGNVLQAAGGQKTSDSVSLSGRAVIGPGNHSITVDWAGASSTVLGSCNLTIFWFKR